MLAEEEPQELLTPKIALLFLVTTHVKHEGELCYYAVFEERC